MALARPYGSPVLINEEWELLKTTDLDGVHFDKVPADIGKIREALHRDFILGITCSNDLEIIRWANQKRADYISFCSRSEEHTSELQSRGQLVCRLRLATNKAQ